MFSVIMLDERMFHFTSAATIRHILEVLLKEIKVRKGCRKGRRGVRGEGSKEIEVLRFLTMG
jgi:hypothetical protein